MAQTTTTITHDDTKELEVKVPRKFGIIPYSAVGRLNTMHANNRRILNVDVFDLMDSLTPTANSLLKLIKDLLDFKTNEATLPKPKSKYESKARSNAIAILKQKGVIKKIGQRSFIVNPYLIVPPVDYQQDVLNKWNSTK